MKLDPGMHIVMHLVSFGKLGVTWRRRDRKGTLVADACGKDTLGDVQFLLWIFFVMMITTIVLYYIICVDWFKWIFDY
jgi:hypothetical protein